MMCGLVGLVCVQSMTMNGELVGPFIFERGLSQDDSLSPCFFLSFVWRVSLAFYKKIESKGDLHSIKVCRGAPILTHFFFFLQHR